jgi:hypothetical protein
MFTYMYILYFYTLFSPTYLFLVPPQHSSFYDHQTFTVNALTLASNKLQSQILLLVHLFVSLGF